MKETKVTVTVKFEVNYDGKVSEDDIDLSDIIRDVDAIKDIKVKTQAVNKVRSIETLDSIVDEVSVKLDSLKLKWMKVYSECGVCRSTNLNESKTLCKECSKCSRITKSI